jgi:uncharacterized membrane protein YvbJ
MQNKQEYFCSNCNTKVDENDTVCKNCGADLSEIVVESGWSRFKEKLTSIINKFSKRHRISYYLFLGPLLMLVTSILIVVLGIFYYNLLKNTVERLDRRTTLPIGRQANYPPYREAGPHCGPAGL